MLIGLHAPMYGGKTTVAEIMKTELDCTVIPFAQPLKDVARSMGWNGKKDDKGRRLLQLLGTECGRQCIHPDLWVHKWLEAASACKTKHVIADDCRFPNEAEAILRMHGIIIQIHGREKKLTMIQRVKRYFGFQYCHRSEIPLDEGLVTHHLDNKGTITDLQTNVRRLLDNVLG